MFRSKPLSSAVKLALGVGAGSFAMSMSAQAQEAGMSDEPVEEIITTGSRIPQDANLVSTSPVATVDADQVKFSGVTRVEDLVNDLPQIVPELTSNDSNGSTGTATLDLRGLGSDRTLVLMNGHRLGFGDPYALAPDINAIPGNLVERIEILTGGASSTYGSDAVSGVVNFIMKTDFEGFQFDVQTSGYMHDNSEGAAQAAISDAGYAQAPSSVSDGEMTNWNVIVGANSGDGRGNVTAYLSYRDIKAITHAERDYSACALGGTSGTVGACRGSSTTPTGSFRDFAAVDPIDLTLDLATGDFVDRTDSYNYGPLNYFQRPDERWTGGLFAHYEVAANVEAYAEFTYMDDRSVAQIAPSGTFFNNTGLNCDNPLMSLQQITAIGCPDALPGSVSATTIYVGRRNVEGGPRFDDISHDSSRSLLGLRGDIGDNWTFDIFANYSRLNFQETYNNDLSISSIIKALDIVDDGSGNAVCRSFLDGSDPNCVAYNIFQPGMVTPAMINYLNLPLYSKADMDQTQAVAFVNGDLTDYGWRIPAAEDGVQVVLGYEYRKDESVFDLDNNYNNGNAAGQGGATADVDGKVGVDEWFAEARIPLVQGRRGFQELSLDLRYRTSDYDLGFDTDTHNVGLSWSPTETFKVRGSASRAVRAPNINELFQPQTIGLWSGTDPCAGAAPTLTEAECALTGVPAGAYGGVPASPADQYNGLFGGNPNLSPEESDSLTVGFVWTPEGADFTMSIDYWNIDVQDAISTVDPEFIIDQCATGNASLCPLIVRNATNGNLWVGSGPTAPRVEATNVNIGFFEVTGYDINLTYAVEVANHGFEFSLMGTALDQWDDQPQPGGAINDCKGTWGGACGRPRPEWKHTFSTNWITPVDGLNSVLTWRHVGSVSEFSANRYTASSQDYFDLVLSYYFELGGGSMQLVGGINNILDESPPFHGLFNTAPYSNGNTIPGTWDPLGQYWFVGLTYSNE